MAEELLIEIVEEVTDITLGDENLLVESNEQGDLGIVRLVWNEIPTGLINGVNNSFTLSQAPVSPKIMLFVRGVKQKLGDDFTLTTNTITFNAGSIPVTGSQIEATYEY